jgi:hypothetical protein
VSVHHVVLSWHNGSKTALQTARQTAVREKMSLYDALISLPADKHLQYEGADGTSAVIDVEVTAAGILYTVLRAQTTDTTGQPRAASRGYAISARADCHLLEQALRDLGIDPDTYRVI